MKKIVTTLITIVILTSMFSAMVSAQEVMTHEQISAVYDDFEKNYCGKKYYSGD